MCQKQRKDGKLQMSLDMPSITLCCQQCVCTHICLFCSDFHAADSVSGSTTHMQLQLDATEGHRSLYKDLKIWELPVSVKSLLSPAEELSVP